MKGVMIISGGFYHMMDSEQNDVYIKGTITYEDFKKYNLYHTKKGRSGFFIFGVLFSLFLVLYNIDELLFLILPLFMIFSIIVTGLATLIITTAVRIRARREFNSDPFIKSEIRYIINENGITQQISKRVNNYLEWDYILKGYELDDMFLIYVSKNKAIIIPKRFFASNDDLHALKKIISRNTNRIKLK